MRRVGAALTAARAGEGRDTSAEANELPAWIVGHQVASDAAMADFRFFGYGRGLSSERQGRFAPGGAVDGVVAKGPVALMRGLGGDTQSAVTINVTVTNAAAAGSVAVVPGDAPTSPPPSTSNVNFAAGQTIGGLVVTKVKASDKTFKIYNASAGPIDVIVDEFGYSDPGENAYGSAFNPIQPVRGYDSRPPGLNCAPTCQPIDPATAPTRTVGLLGTAVPGVAWNNVSAVSLNVTVVNQSQTASGWLSVAPGVTNSGTSSNISFGPGQTIAGAVIVGSPTAEVRHSIAWEGSHCGNGDITCGPVNGVLVADVRDTIQLSATSPLAIQMVGDRAAASLSASGSDSSTADLVQQRRAQRQSAQSFTAAVPGASTTGLQATGGVLSVTGAQGGVAVALDHMHRFEPQALRLQAGRRIAIDVVGQGAYLGARQGTYAELAVAAVASSPSRATLDSSVWAPRNHPLRAWPSAEWFAGSGAVDPFPAGALPAQWGAFDSHVASTLQSTLQNTDSKGISGVMSYGSFPRTWGTELYGDELDCFGNDPTPAQQWDNTYWCASWTDYHNVSAVAAMWAMRTGDTRWLDSISAPAAKRMQLTQIMQCSPTDAYFYCGQAPAGYGGFRADFNSSHAYFDNLFLHYWLTGDKTIVKQIQRGASSMRDYLCQRRPATTCQPGDPQPDEWAILSGRVGSQWLAAFRFVGLASGDESYLDDWHGLMGVSVSRHYAQVSSGGVAYGFWTDGVMGGPGTFDTGQLWMVSLYDMRNVRRLMDDTNDAPFSSPSVRPSEVLTSWSRTLVRYGSTVSGDGTAGGDWPNGLRFAFSGNRVGGTLTSVSASPGGSDPLLYDTGKSTLTAVLAQSGEIASDPTLAAMAGDLTEVALAGMQYEGGPLSKIQGEYLNRTPTALALLGP